MKIKKKVWVTIIFSVPAIYFFLLAFLYTAESGNPESKIQTMGDAWWYSLVTITTVGYGDLIPSTMAGKVIGSIFLIASAGLMVTLMTAMVTFVAGEAYPLFLLRFQKRKNWYYFADITTESIVLARNIGNEESDAVIIFGDKNRAKQETINYPCYMLKTPLEKLVKIKGADGSPIHLFFMKENDFGQNLRALEMFRLPVIVYARTSYGQASKRENVNFFHSSDCCARRYWINEPLKTHEKQIVIIGFGEYGSNLLERAILTNIRSLEQNVTYHVYGDASTFLHIHRGLNQIFRIIQMKENKETGMIEEEHYYRPDSTVLDAEELDTLVFHSEPWEMSHDLFSKADRVIICEDDEVLCRNIYWNLERYYAIKGEIHLRSNRSITGIKSFGTNDEIYNPGEILRTALNDGAIAVNNIYRKSTTEKTLSFRELPEHLQESKIAVADHLRMKIRILMEDEECSLDCKEVTPDILEKAYAIYLERTAVEEKLEEFRELEHQRWLRFYAYKNFTYGENVDLHKHTHPMFRHYRDLPEETRKERENAWVLIGKLSRIIKEY